MKIAILGVGYLALQVVVMKAVVVFLAQLNQWLEPFSPLVRVRVRVRARALTLTLTLSLSLTLTQVVALAFTLVSVRARARVSYP